MNAFVGALLLALLAVGVRPVYADFLQPRWTACPEQVRVAKADRYQIEVKSTGPLRRLQREFFGFNLEWVEFERSLWNPDTGALQPGVGDWLRPFAGATYRYPGGVASNVSNWRDTTGERDSRPERRYVEWLPPVKVRFGLDEYLQFLKEVDGTGWYVANITGDQSGERPVAALAEEAAGLVRHAREKATAGFPLIRNWEMGNELDRGHYRWPSEKFIARARPVAEAIRRVQPDSRIAVIAQEYDAVGSARTYNRAVASAMASMDSDYSIHLYYDGEPQPPVPDMLDRLCKASADVVAATGKPARLWLTEHARVPRGAFAKGGWKELWPGTADLNAAIAVADMMIATFQIPEVQGASIHALHGTDGPWPLFHRNRSGKLHAGAVYWGARLVRDSHLPVVLSTLSRGPRRSDYEGGYDMRGVVLASEDARSHSVILVNRSGEDIDVELVLPGRAGQTANGFFRVLTADRGNANNYLQADRVVPVEKAGAVTFDKRSMTVLEVPRFSVFTLSLPEASQRNN